MPEVKQTVNSFWASDPALALDSGSDLALAAIRAVSVHPGVSAPHAAFVSRVNPMAVSRAEPVTRVPASRFSLLRTEPPASAASVKSIFAIAYCSPALYDKK